MSDESNAQEQQAQAPEQPTAGDTQPVAAQAERTFTQADVDRIITERLTKEKAKAESMATKAREDAERKAALRAAEVSLMPRMIIPNTTND